MSTPSIAITGSTGHLGRLVVDNLKTRVPAENVVALARSLEKAADLGVPAREADYSRPETLVPALRGVETLLLISSNEIGKRVEQQRNAIRAAQEAGVRRIVYTSILRADRSPIDLAEEHLATERDLEASGLESTILRNGWYTENYTDSIGRTLANGAILGSAGEGKFSFATRRDYAEAAVAVLIGDGYEGKTFELAGDQAVTLAQLAAEITRQAGKEVVYKDMPTPEYAATLQSFGLPEALANSIASWDAGAAEGALYDDGYELSALIGRPTTPIADAVAEALRRAA